MIRPLWLALVMCYMIALIAIWIKEAHKRNIKIHTWFESFYIGNKSPEINPKSILAVKPEWMNRTKQKADYLGYVPHPQEHNGYFLDPANPEVIEFLIKLIDEITTKYNVDGVNVDTLDIQTFQKKITTINGDILHLQEMNLNKYMKLTQLKSNRIV